MRVLATTGHPELGSRRQATKNGRIPLSFLATSAASNRIQAEYESGWELRLRDRRRPVTIVIRGSAGGRTLLTRGPVLCDRPVFGDPAILRSRPPLRRSL